MKTLPDLVRPGLRLIMVGINPSLYAVEKGHYFARPQNRFWPAFSRSRLSRAMREGLGVERLWPEHDQEFPSFGFGLTDIVKVPSAQAAHLPPRLFREWAPRTRAELEKLQARVIAFHGMTAYRPFLKYGLSRSDSGIELGEQPVMLGDSTLFVLPNPSPANASYSLEDLVGWYDRLDEVVNR